MSDRTFHQAVRHIKEFKATFSSDVITLGFHGGEPCLVGPGKFAKWCSFALKELEAPDRHISFVIQTNGTLLSKDWCSVFADFNVSVGVSLDGPEHINDENRINHSGNGSHNSVIEGLEVLRGHNIPFTILCVIPLGHPPLEVHQHLLNLSPNRINYLLPDYTHDTIEGVRLKHGRAPCADFLIPIFEHWWENGKMDLQITLFEQIARLVLGGSSSLDTFGNSSLPFIFIEADGEIEVLDVLKVCDNGFCKTGLNVHQHTLERVLDLSGPLGSILRGSVSPPPDCITCPEQITCGGGYLPHRYSKTSGFANPSVWCEDIKIIFHKIRDRLGVDAHETAIRANVLKGIAHEFTSMPNNQ